MAKHLQIWASEMPDLFFHYTTRGDEAIAGAEGENWRVYRYINYEQCIGQFTAVVHHGGAGIAYHCLKPAYPRWFGNRIMINLISQPASAITAWRCDAGTRRPSRGPSDTC